MTAAGCILSRKNCVYSAMCCRVIVDSWLEIQFQNSSDGVGVLAAVQKLRSTMIDLLRIKLELNSQQQYHQILFVTSCLSHRCI